jgi:hypothetical protein
MKRKLIDLFNDALDICLEDERKDGDFHYSLDSFEDVDKAGEFERLTDIATEYLYDYSVDILDYINDLIANGLAYEVIIEYAVDMIEQKEALI